MGVAYLSLLPPSLPPAFPPSLLPCLLLSLPFFFFSFVVLSHFRHVFNGKVCFPHISQHGVCSYTCMHANGSPDGGLEELLDALLALRRSSETGGSNWMTYLVRCWLLALLLNCTSVVLSVFLVWGFFFSILINILCNLLPFKESVLKLFAGRFISFSSD